MKTAGKLGMEIEFLRTGERRYAVKIRRPDGSALEMNPAPGYDPVMPHDLLHYVVESELGLRCGIFGQIADGGGAGTFHLVPTTAEGKREAARRRRRLAERDARLLREGRRDSAASEQAVYVCQREWLTRRGDPERYGSSKVEAERAPRAPAPTGFISDQCLDRICDRLDQLSGRWTGIEVGESVTVEWPRGA